MLRKKLKLDEKIGDDASPIGTLNSKGSSLTSKHFSEPIWSQFYNIECKLNDDLRKIKYNSKVTHVYNPIEYASDLHCAYLKKFLTGRKEVMFIGMNPGPNGMAQTGIPFGNIKTVRDLMKLDGEVGAPENLHPQRPVKGLKCETEEPSGKRIWGLMLEISGDLEVFGKQCFMHNFCPLTFYDKRGKNLTPSELSGNIKLEIRDICLKYLEEKIDLVSPKIIIAIGTYVDDCLKIIRKRPKFQNSSIIFLKLAHPSPRSLNNTNWPEKAKSFFEEHNLIMYLKGEA